MQFGNYYVNDIEPSRQRVEISPGYQILEKHQEPCSFRTPKELISPLAQDIFNYVPGIMTLTECTHSIVVLHHEDADFYIDIWPFLEQILDNHFYPDIRRFYTPPCCRVDEKHPELPSRNILSLPSGKPKKEA